MRRSAKAWSYLFGKSRTSEIVFKVVWSLFVVLGALMSLDSLISLADSALFLLSVFNIIGLCLLAPVVKRKLNSFLEFVRARKAGEISDGGEDQESVKTTVCPPRRPGSGAGPRSPRALVGTGPHVCRYD